MLEQRLYGVVIIIFGCVIDRRNLMIYVSALLFIGWWGFVRKVCVISSSSHGVYVWCVLVSMRLCGCVCVANRTSDKILRRNGRSLASAAPKRVCACERAYSDERTNVALTNLASGMLHHWRRARDSRASRLGAPKRCSAAAHLDSQAPMASSAATVARAHSASGG